MGKLLSGGLKWPNRCPPSVTGSGLPKKGMASGEADTTRRLFSHPARRVFSPMQRGVSPEPSERPRRRLSLPQARGEEGSPRGHRLSEGPVPPAPVLSWACGVWWAWGDAAQTLPSGCALGTSGALEPPLDTGAGGLLSVWPAQLCRVYRPYPPPPPGLTQVGALHSTPISAPGTTQGRELSAPTRGLTLRDE